MTIEVQNVLAPPQLGLTKSDTFEKRNMLTPLQLGLIKYDTSAPPPLGLTTANDYGSAGSVKFPIGLRLGGFNFQFFPSLY